ncbi:MAG: glucose-1-phosphate thymidylyltransferase RfbA [Bdellovibrionales bacterium]|nr:glucose-1-phosphate thymidylyltransferase RfbA [Bdellovibrionales bacterium]
MKGIVLAGGSGSRLYPITKGTSKQLLPVYDKPLIYYPVSTLLLLGITEILIISSPRDLPLIEGLLGTGEQLGVQFTYLVQESPKGIAEAFILGESFIDGAPVALILGDNIFHGDQLAKSLKRGIGLEKGAHIVAYRVKDPERFGVVEFDADYRPLKIVEKPDKPKSNWAVTGLYFYGPEVVDVAKSVQPSNRGELEITAVNSAFLERGGLTVSLCGRGVAWMDAGTPDALLSASSYFQCLDKRQGLQVACLEEVAFRMGYISREELLKQARELSDCTYAKYLKEVVLGENE